MLGTILIVVLLLALFGALPRWSHSSNWGYLSERRTGPGSLNRCRASASRTNLSSVPLAGLAARRLIREYA